jgi:galactokinase
MRGVVAQAPGRVNLIGEHTDYNGGFVLPMAIPQETHVALTRRDDRQVVASSVNLPDGNAAAFTLGSEQKLGNWIDYVQGTTAALRAAGHRIEGFDLIVDSSVPIGSGLSSSAALEVALLRGLRELFELDLDDVAVAKIGRAAETDFVGAPIGIMDQMASSLADRETALFLDTRSLAYERIPLPPSIEVIVIDSGLSHDHATGNYRTRRSECELAAKLLGVAELRDVDDVTRLDGLPAPLDRRARHVVTENARVLEAVRCLRESAIVSLGRLFDESHASMRDSFEISVPGVDRLVAIARADAGVVGARMTGGGFGGAIVALTTAGAGREAATRIADIYRREGPATPSVLVPAPRTKENHG